MSKKYKNNKKESFYSKNKYNILIIFILFIVIISFIVIRQKPALAPASLLGYGGISNLDESPVSNDDIDSYKVSPDKPRILIIPKINTKARIFEVGLTNDNAIDTTKGIYDVGWYSGSDIPGQKGNAFIDGHVSGPNNKGIFYDLKKLDINDEIEIEMGNGKKYTFFVKNKEELKLQNVDMRKVLDGNELGIESLTLMTCSGKYIKSEDTYSHRYVVYATIKN